VTGRPPNAAAPPTSISPSDPGVWFWLKARGNLHTSPHRSVAEPNWISTEPHEGIDTR